MLDLDEISQWIAGDRWHAAFDEEALVRGKRLASARLVRDVTGECLPDTGDVEVRGAVFDKDGERADPSVVLWAEDGVIRSDTGCSCAVGAGCPHAAALLFHQAKGRGARVSTALGVVANVEQTVRGGETVRTATEWFAEPPVRKPGEPQRVIRVERRPAARHLAWVPEVFARAFVVYGEERVALARGTASGRAGPAADAPLRNTAVETRAVGDLDRLGLVPGAEEPPVSLKKIEVPDFGSRLWTPDRKRFPYPRLFWQKFWVEWGPELERAGWTVQYAPDIQIRPLQFRTENWSAEIVDEGKGWFHLSAGFEVDGERFDLQPILAALVKNRFLENTAKKPAGQEFVVFLPDGRGLAVPIGRFRRILTTLGDLLDYRFTEGPVRLGKLDAAALVSPDRGEEPSWVSRLPGELEELAGQLTDFRGIAEVPPPEGLRATLRHYQLEGYRWLQFLARHELHGILADDMGLGKTLQTLAHLLREVETDRNEGRPSLVIAPTSVVRNWQREAEKFAPVLRILVHQGPGRESNFPRMRACDLVITSYALIHRDIDRFASLGFHLLILDEAQHIKNPEARTTRAVGRLRAQHRLCLSGTPVENHLGELWSAMHFLQPGWLGSRELFQATYRNPIERDKNAARAAALARRIRPLILRRTKEEVAKELPPKTEMVHAVTMRRAQADLYETVRSTMDRQVREALRLQGRENQMVFLDALLKLRQICCHPRLLGESHRHEASAKFEMLVDLLETLRRERHRVLVFSQFTSMLRLIEDHLRAVGSPYLMLTGESRDRQELVERFQAGEGEVFLISLKAGGTGLTLTGADTVIHYDPWWNPAVENQATDRAYRIGQDKPVMVHKLVCAGTVEERIQTMQERKHDLAEGLFGGAMKGIELTPEVFAELFQPLGGLA